MWVFVFFFTVALPAPPGPLLYIDRSGLEAPLPSVPSGCHDCRTTLATDLAMHGPMFCAAVSAPGCGGEEFLVVAGCMSFAFYTA